MILDVCAEQIGQLVQIGHCQYHSGNLSLEITTLWQQAHVTSWGYDVCRVRRYCLEICIKLDYVEIKYPVFWSRGTKSQNILATATEF